MPAFIDLTGRVFGKLTVIARNGTLWDCQCNCGGRKLVNGNQLRGGHTRSCGCLVRESNGTHLMSGTPTYNAWRAMIDRCSRPTHKQYDRYGGRGISVHEPWRRFENFFADMGACPDGLSLDRINNDGNYEPGNCRWTTKFVQSNNTRWNVVYELHGESKTVSQWGKEYGLHPTTIKHRIRYLGWTVEAAITTPVAASQRHRSAHVTTMTSAHSASAISKSATSPRPPSSSSNSSS